MDTLSVHEMLEATGGKLILGDPGGSADGLSIDSRTIGEGEFFVAIKGARFDGHDFLAEALQSGAGAVVSIPPVEPARGKTVIHVNNTLKALQDIARHRRRRVGIPVIAITGSNGKTTTKELIASILGTKHRVLKNIGNLNNQVGLPLSLVRLGADDEAAVLEMGASVRGDIAELCSIAEPDYGVITNIGYVHLEGFGNIEGVRETKLEILQFVKAAAVNADDRFMMNGLGGFGGDVVTFGVENPADVTATDISLSERGSRFTLRVPGGGSIRVRLNIPGMFNIYNALAASAAGRFMGVGLTETAAALEGFTGVPMRYEIKEFKGATVISDVYNANPASMEEALKELVRIRQGRAIAVLGDMLELGSYAAEAHRKLGRWMANLPVDVFIAVGPMMAGAAREFLDATEDGEAITALDAKEAREALLRCCSGGSDTVLVKGSRAMKMEEVLGNNAG